MKDLLPELNGKDYIKKLDSNYDIHFCRADQVDKLIKFIDDYWKGDHIFVLSRELFDWQHYDKANDRYNFVVAEEKATGEFHSILGFVPSKQFDPKIKYTLVWPCIWKNSDDISVKGIGVALYYYLKSQLSIDTFVMSGISDVALGIYKHWNFTTGVSKQWYILNNSLKSFKLVGGKPLEHLFFPEEDLKNEKKLLKLEGDEILNTVSSLCEAIPPYKSVEYYNNRFILHPIYHYDFYAVYKGDALKSIMITRICSANNAKAIRIVDYIGKFDELSGTFGQLQELMNKENAEYIDLVNSGINEKIFKQSGFSDRDKGDIIVPNYYEPFFLSNVEMRYAYKTTNNSYDAIINKALVKLT